MVADALKERKFDIDTIQACVSAVTRTSLLLAVGHEQSQMLEDAGRRAVWRADKSNPQTTVDRQKLVRAQEAGCRVLSCVPSRQDVGCVIPIGPKPVGCACSVRQQEPPQSTIERQKLVRAREAACQGVELCAKPAGSGMCDTNRAEASGLRVL